LAAAQGIPAAKNGGCKPKSDISKGRFATHTPPQFWVVILALRRKTRVARVVRLARSLETEIGAGSGYHFRAGISVLVMNRTAPLLKRIFAPAGA